jgi:hypothetical protein
VAVLCRTKSNKSPGLARLVIDRSGGTPPTAGRLRQCELEDFGLATTGSQGEPGNCNRQGESPRTGAARVDEKRLAPRLDRRLVGVAEDYGGEARGPRIEVELREVVENVDRVATDLDHVVGGKALSPHALVVVAADRADRRKPSERLEDGRVTDVAAMNDELRTPERVECSGPNQSMGI